MLVLTLLFQTSFKDLKFTLSLSNPEESRFVVLEEGVNG